MSRSQTPPVAAAVAHAIAHPGLSQKAIARMFKINRVTLSRALSKVRPRCPACKRALGKLAASGKPVNI